MSSTDVARQKHFFDAWDELERCPPPPRDPHVTAEDVPRLTGQNAAILERLKRGPATNRELAQISLKYTSRISDLRAAGYRIRCSRLRGTSIYRLERSL